MWRNWQTRRSQKPVMVTSWRFDPSHPHFKTAGASHINGSPFFRFAFLFMRGKLFLNESACVQHQSIV